VFAASLRRRNTISITYPGVNSLDASAGTLPAVNCVRTLGANGTITIYVPLSNVHEAGAIDSRRLHEVTASTMTLSQPANAVPSTAGLGGVLFNLIDVAQGYVFDPLLPTSVVSRKQHGGAGIFDLTLNPGTPVTIEPRSGGNPNGTHTLVFSFLNTLNASNPVSSVIATATTGGGTQSVTASGQLLTDHHLYQVDLTGVPNASHVTVTLHGVTDSVSNNGDVSAHMDVLLGDVNQSGRVDGTDVSDVRQQNFQTLSGPPLGNYLDDINTSGRIDGTDVSIARQQNFTILP
jgi:hypothetical protein